MHWFTYIKHLIFFLEIANVLSCSVPAFNNLTVQSNFSLTQFLGGWYEIKWTPGDPHNESDIWRNFYQSFQLQNASSSILQVDGRARLLNANSCFSFGPWIIIANNSAKMILQKKDPNSQKILNWPYYILKTDYNNYALAYACSSTNYTLSNLCEKPTLWVFSRTTMLSDALMAPLDEYITNILCINVTTLEITPQDGKRCSLSSQISVENFILLTFLFVTFIVKTEREFI
ncbi:unnamed protein product [Adineta ricciae]|uniref:Apolipoprotein D n=1 Tax=Adineta ricciae TaxID=249248 RepID=A0A816DB52_ADIRI|nr:unnamed protein product [Adineta ricciae]